MTTCPHDSITENVCDDCEGHIDRIPQQIAVIGHRRDYLPYSNSDDHYHVPSIEKAYDMEFRGHIVVSDNVDIELVRYVQSRIEK